MTLFSKKINADSDYTLNSDGIYEATILASEHNLGNGIHILRAERRNGNYGYENIILAHELCLNGDMKVFMSEPTTFYITIATDQ